MHFFLGNLSSQRTLFHQKGHSLQPLNTVTHYLDNYPQKEIWPDLKGSKIELMTSHPVISMTHVNFPNFRPKLEKEPFVAPGLKCVVCQTRDVDNPLVLCQFKYQDAQRGGEDYTWSTSTLTTQFKLHLKCIGEGWGKVINVFPCNPLTPLMAFCRLHIITLILWDINLWHKYRISSHCLGLFLMEGYPRGVPHHPCYPFIPHYWSSLTLKSDRGNKLV